MQISKRQKGFTLVEVIVSTAIIAMLGLVVMQIYFAVISQVTNYRTQAVVVSLADQYMEIARNLPYSQIGTLSGNPHGNLADAPNAINATVNGNSYQIYYVVNYVDDPADGTALAGTDTAPNDYKQVKLYVKNTKTGALSSFVTTIVPQGLEGLASGGALSIKVFNAVGQPVSGATITIQNTALNPAINLTRTSDTNGDWTEVGLPDSANSYHIVVTKSGYSTDQTYAVSQQNSNPIKENATIANGQVTQISFSIDQLSNLTFNIQNQTCGPLASVGMNVSGSKLIGMPNVLKFNNDYTSDAAGQIILNNIEWDSYVPTLLGSTYMIYGTSPTQQATILPGTNETFGLIIGPKTANALLVIVKDASTGNAIEGANVDLETLSPPTDDNETTGGSMWSQQDWSDGPGQTVFADPKAYYTDDGNVNTTTVPLGLRLASFNGAYSTSGVLTSSTFDTGTNATSYTTLSWQPTSQDPATSLKFQIATNNDNATWNYIGPDGTVNTYYTVPGTTISMANNNAEYIRYRVFLSTNNTSKTPVLTSVNVNYVSGCFTPGQVIFPGLDSTAHYQLVVSANGYQTQNISNMSVSGYQVLGVPMSP